MSNAVSLNPEEFVEGGGLIDDVDVVMKECVFDMFDYNGKMVPGVPALKIVMELGEGEEATQYYSMGSNADWIPSEDGSQLLAVGKATNIRMSSNGGIFLKSLIDAGFPAEDLGDDITVLDGLQAHVIRVPAPKRPGIKKETEKKFEDTILIIGDIIAMPGEKKKPAGAVKGKGKGKGKGKAATSKAKPAKETPPAAEESDEVTDKAMAAVLDLLESEGTVSKKDLPAKIFQTMKADPDRNAIIKIVFDDTFLEEGPWDFEDGMLIGG